MKDWDHDDIHFESLKNLKDSQNLSCVAILFSSETVRDNIIGTCETFANSRTDSKDQSRVKLKTCGQRLDKGQTYIRFATNQSMSPQIITWL